MYTTNIDCVACHRKTQEGHAALHTTQYAERAIEEACVDCHGSGFDEMLRHWRSLLAKAENETNQRILNAQKALSEFEKNAGRSAEFRRAQTLLNEARNNYSTVLLGRGVHNIEYAIKLLNVGNNKAEQAMGIIDKSYQPRELRTEMTCTTLCHVGIEKRPVPFNDVKFGHETHVAGLGLKCSGCHSPRENHGKTYLKNCAECHHGREIKAVSCEDCHVKVKRLLQGKGGLGVQERPSVKLGTVKCTECHRSVLAKKKDTVEMLKKRCVDCHDEGYGEMLVQWKATSQDLLKKVSAKMAEVQNQIDRIELRGGRTFVYRKLYGDAELNYNLAKQGNSVHNMEYVEELLDYANQRLDEALRQLARRQTEVARGKM
jgi:hypothetical protein